MQSGENKTNTLVVAQRAQRNGLEHPRIRADRRPKQVHVYACASHSTTIHTHARHHSAKGTGVSATAPSSGQLFVKGGTVQAHMLSPSS